MILDRSRGWKQVIEANAIIGAILGTNKFTNNHPVVRMWKGYVNALKLYYNTFLKHCIDEHKMNIVKMKEIVIPELTLIELPPWIGYEPFHAAHRSNLLRKDPDYYGQFGWKEPDNLEYVWPVDKEGKFVKKEIEGLD